VEGKGKKEKPKEEILPYILELQTQWRNDIGMPLRFPRFAYEEVVTLANAAWPPEVFMQEHLKTTDIVVRFPVSSRQLSDVDREILFENNAPLSRVFEDVISKAPVKKGSTVNAKLAAEAYFAYKATWLLLFQSLYVDRLDPRANVKKRGDAPKLDKPKWFETMEQVFKSRRSPGAPTKDDDDRLRTRLKLLIDYCESLHRQIIEHQAEQRIAIESRRVNILRNFWRAILKIPGGVSILGGEAFLKIAYEKRDNPPKLEDPATWKPRQLAIALLAFEEGHAYHTIERKFPMKKKPKR
jgi:hypothetical protein